MANTFASDFKIYNPEFQAGMWEGITQFVNAFNAASRNGIRLVTEQQLGQYSKEAFLQDLSTLISRRDVTSASAATKLKMTQGEIASVKIQRKVGPVSIMMDALRKIGSDQQSISFILGQMTGQKKAQDMLNTGVLSAEAAIEGQAALVYDATGQSTKTLTTDHLVSGLAKMGDAAERVVAWVMHSKPYFDLTKNQISAGVMNVADRVIYGATPGTLNRPVVLSDIPALHDDNDSATDTYNVLGLVSNGVMITETEMSEIFSQINLGGENVELIIQGEHAYNVGVQGFTWNISGGGANPTDAALGTTSNWTKTKTSDKDLAGVRIKVQ